MGPARTKLNAAAIRGVLLVAGMAAALCRSWELFLGIGVVLVLTAIHAGDIRLHSRRR